MTPRPSATLLVLGLAFSASAQPACDLVIRNGHVIDPKRNTSRVLDVAVANGRARPEGHS